VFLHREVPQGLKVWSNNCAYKANFSHFLHDSEKLNITLVIWKQTKNKLCLIKIVLDSYMLKLHSFGNGGSSKLWQPKTKWLGLYKEVNWSSLGDLGRCQMKHALIIILLSMISHGASGMNSWLNIISFYKRHKG
jgi:hypothetical protein